MLWVRTGYGDLHAKFGVTEDGEQSQDAEDDGGAGVLQASRPVRTKMPAPMPNHMRSHQLSVFFISFWIRALTSTSFVWSKEWVTWPWGGLFEEEGGGDEEAWVCG